MMDRAEQELVVDAVLESARVKVQLLELAVELAEDARTKWVARRIRAILGDA